MKFTPLISVALLFLLMSPGAYSQPAEPPTPAAEAFPQPQPQPQPAEPPTPAAEAFAIPAGATPEEVSLIYFKILKEHRWDDLGLVYHEDSLKEFREMMQFLQETDNPQAHQIRVMMFGPDASIEGVTALSDSVFFTKILNTLMTRAASIGTIDFQKVDIIGSLPEGDDTYHVVARLYAGVGDKPVNNVDLITYKKQDDSWRLMLSGKLRGMGASMKRAIEGPKPPR